MSFVTIYILPEYYYTRNNWIHSQITSDRLSPLRLQPGARVSSPLMAWSPFVGIKSWICFRQRCYIQHHDLLLLSRFLVWCLLDYFLHGIRTHPRSNRILLRLLLFAQITSRSCYIWNYYDRRTTMSFFLDLCLIFWFWFIVITVCGWCLCFCCCGTITKRVLLNHLTVYLVFLVRCSHLLLCALDLIYIGLASLIFFVLIWLFQGFWLICYTIRNP